MSIKITVTFQSLSAFYLNFRLHIHLQLHQHFNIYPHLYLQQITQLELRWSGLRSTIKSPKWERWTKKMITTMSPLRPINGQIYVSVIVSRLDSLACFYVALSTVSPPAIVADEHRFRSIVSYNAYIGRLAKGKEAFSAELTLCTVYKLL